MMAMILEHVNYSYGVGTGKEFHALKDINLQIGDHEFIGLVGHSGSGKSTVDEWAFACNGRYHLLGWTRYL